MDRTLQSPLLGTKSPFSARPRHSTGLKRSAVASPVLRKPSRFSVSGKSTQSVQIIHKTPYNYVERFGQPLPVLVTEALTFVDRNTILTARISECGFAWVVCGRKLLIWQYRQSPAAAAPGAASAPGTPQRRQALLNQCYELQLPQSDLAHRAELVSVFQTPGSHTPCCIAVSPEGVVRYWPAVAHEDVSIEQSIDLRGQECDSLTEVAGLGCILATTTCTVVLVQPHFASGRHTLQCRPLKTPSGWLGGFSRRMSSLIFGPISAEHLAETRLVRVLTVSSADTNTWTVFVLAGHSLQKWRLSAKEPEQLIFVAELNRLVRDGFHVSVWDNCVADHTETDTWLLDIQSDKNNIIILAAAVNMQMSAQLHYALICIDTSGNQTPTAVKDFLLLKVSALYREDGSNDSFLYRFLLCGTNAYLYNSRSIVVIKPQEEPDTIEFNSPQDFLLGGSVCVNTPIFFSKNYGLISVSSNELLPDLNMSQTIPSQIENSFSNETTAANNLTVYNLDADDVFNAHKDTLGQFKAAFIFHVKRQQSSCQDIIQELFLTEGNVLPGIDTVLDKVVVKTCEDLLDDMPARDPRWEIQENQVALGSSYSMQIVHQLEDKRKALNLYFNFLRETDLWGKLSACTYRDNSLATVYILGELSEKLVAALTLKNLPVNAHLENAIKRTVEDAVAEQEFRLSPQDVFYREVTKIHRALKELTVGCEEVAHSDLNPKEIAKIISETNDILLAVLRDVVEYRQRNSQNFVPTAGVVALAPDYLPWTAAPGHDLVFDALMLQQSLTFNYGIKNCQDSNLSSILYDQFVHLIDIILDGRKCHLESIRGTPRENVLIKQYEVDRHKLISPLLVEKEWERAAVLAEKYLDFEALTIICESTDNQARLDEYMERFTNEGFSEFVYTWYLQENKQGKLINKCRQLGKSKNMQKLSGFLSAHASLAWLQHIYEKKFAHASDVLQNLARDETESVVRKKTMLSLAKLAKIAAPGVAEGDFNVQNINAQLDLVGFQEELPDYVLERYGYNVLKPCVIPAKDLIALYVCPEFKDAGEVEFKKALEILRYVEDEELREELNLKVWRSAILRDSWHLGGVDSPLEFLEHTLFYKLVDLAIVLGADPQNLLPPLDLLIDDDGFGELRQNKNFLYLLKTGYEHMQKGSVF